MLFMAFDGHPEIRHVRPRGKSCWDISHIRQLTYFSFTFTFRTVRLTLIDSLINIKNFGINFVRMQLQRGISGSFPQGVLLTLALPQCRACPNFLYLPCLMY